MTGRGLTLGVLLLTLTACSGAPFGGTEAAPDVKETAAAARMQETGSEEVSGPETAAAEPEGSGSDYVTDGTEIYREFVVDSVLHSGEMGDIHYCIYTPEEYDGSEAYGLYVTLPGYQGLYFQGTAMNIRTEEFAFEAQKYNDKMIILAPQLDDWGETSARKELYTAALMCSSKWDGGYDAVVEAKLPVYFVIGESDEYYGAEPFRSAYREIYERYEAEGLSEEEIRFHDRRQKSGVL